ncbi:MULTISPECIES: hypothetical protein [Photorhabdus]|nr:MULTISPECIES: hypothetical protein [Photorhabdus]AWK41845.1 hypothetical protein A4R40_10280 [Photorhabdus laumondii subsp. laumondii]KTL60183.1 hypothetical protein AA106_14310 [Photorhabdus laumondii subsp. laumondii]RAW71272.1 hypothetical protein CKY15_09675 [Photorhabdus sp. S7-51]RAW72623.1 hypothetical protein CKY14_09465 [Photorhabdus sp. S14-60]RAW77719.1 hypothetical protein CKY06_10940 [Photorhabdus sp. S15-56]
MVGFIYSWKVNVIINIFEMKWMEKSYFHILDRNGFNICLVLGSLKFIAIFAQNKRVKSINDDGEVVYYNDGELCDIPDGRVINVRVQLPEKP